MSAPNHDPARRNAAGVLLTRSGVDTAAVARYAGVLPNSTDPDVIVSALRDQAAVDDRLARRARARNDDAMAWRYRAAAIEQRAIARRLARRTR